MTFLPTLNAILNTVSATLAVIGYAFIRHGKAGAHRACMLGAVVGSVFFMASYLAYHVAVGSVRFQGTGTLRLVYLAVLASHSILAAVLPLLLLATLIRAVRGRFAGHRRLARWTLPIWLYVSLTGVAVYWLLYHAAGPGPLP